MSSRPCASLREYGSRFIRCRAESCSIDLLTMTTREETNDIVSSARAGRRRGLNLRGLAQALIGVVALALLIMKSDTRGLIEAIKATRIAYVSLAVAASFIVTYLMAYRWGAILSVR